MGTGTETPRFEDALDVTPLDDGRNWQVTAPFYYDTDVVLTPMRPAPDNPYVRLVLDPSSHPVTHDEYCQASHWRITIPADFITDFASVPRFFWRFLPPTGRYTRAAVVHDFLYRTPGLCTRAQADAVLYEAMKFPCHVGFFTRWTIYAGVRAGGSVSYKGGL